MPSATNRADKINKLFKIAKKHFQPVSPPSNRTVIEHLLYGCCLEDASYELADEVFARLQEEYFDWNEVRVTTTAELAEVMKKLPDATEAANRIRKSLHGLFEAHYSFDVEFLRKENLGKAIEQLAKYRGMSPFCVSYIAQSALGGHAIPIDDALMKLMFAIDVIGEADGQNHRITGLERTIPKNKGIEFFSLVHQLAVNFRDNPFNKDVRAIILEIDSTAQERFPRRGGRKKEEAIEEVVVEKLPAKGKGVKSPPPEPSKPVKTSKAEDKLKKPEKVFEKIVPAKSAEKRQDKKKAGIPPKAKKIDKVSMQKKAEKTASHKKAIRRKPR